MGKEVIIAEKKPDHDGGLVEISVNKKPVRIAKGDHTGLEIKDAAIEQGVEIKRDFILSLEKGEGKDDKARVIGDDEVIKVHEHMRFRAVDDDDNS
jgi:hypothetical protein